MEIKNIYTWKKLIHQLFEYMKHMPSYIYLYCVRTGEFYFLRFQEETIPFNRALLLNVGFLEANKVHDYQCYVFHDVDLIPENDHNMYSCPEQPRHMSVAVDKMNYR